MQPQVASTAPPRKAKQDIIRMVALAVAHHAEVRDRDFMIQSTISAAGYWTSMG